MTPGAALALTMGDPAGIGTEVTLKAWQAFHAAPGAAPPFFLIDDPERVAAIASGMGLGVPVAAIASPGEAPALSARALPVLRHRPAERVEPGRPDPGHARAIIESIDRAVELVTRGEAAAVVTNPINKESLLGAGFAHAGHTAYLAELAGGCAVDMMLVCPELRVVPLTVHRPLREAIKSVTREVLASCIARTALALVRDFGLDRPRIVVAGLNPHAGEGGTLGREDLDEIAPAVAASKAAGLDVRGPLPADSLFYPGARAGYDAAICMYHDQALIPIKTIDFWNGVNVTIGLPFVRTSPDHGTAFDIAGRGTARPDSLIAAIRLGAELSRRRAAAADAA